MTKLQPMRIAPEPCGKCQLPSCLQCFPFERPRNPPTPNDPYQTILPMVSSMLDEAPQDLDELEAAGLVLDKASGMTPEQLKTLRAFNDKNNVEAPVRRLDDVVEPKTADKIKKMFPPHAVANILQDTRPHPKGSDKMVLDFTGEIDGGGVKDSMKNTNSKPRMALVPRALIIGCARVLTYGAIKYATNNWRRGMRWGEPADALLRHFFAWLEGENNDPESGESHLSHMAANLAFLMHMASDPAYAELDDRPRIK